MGERKYLTYKEVEQMKLEKGTPLTVVHEQMRDGKRQPLDELRGYFCFVFADSDKGAEAKIGMSSSYNGSRNIHRTVSMEVNGILEITVEKTHIEKFQQSDKQ